ncbi:MAG: hypothetical protein A2919_00485 [Candidatus Spechtbacteria bacterium RIFCSPLOWO2_01_FULL_43_12]|uniref:Uncharacterized protein n=1 Tax=Candidatus Spechtbacteria bacterium RIFCSPLOWO2_01_FULL_43_12 TaxID=1802162 RepID=A0A1G2HEQ2_9BACT|nr:MAG: hypothetical protein A2919_00485 [Candidatus Spechtbacteria bacterium RIFCSPLOWO2_01_FULL_43_12]
MANLFDRWWSNFIQWSIIIVPLLLSLWIAGFFLQAQTACPQAAPTPAEVTNTFDNVEICKATTQVLALGVLIMGIMASLSFSAAGSRAIINNTKRQYQRGVKASGRWAEKQAYLRAPGAGKFMAEKVPGAAGAGRIGAQIGRAIGEVPGVKRLVAPAIRMGVSRREEALGEWKKIKDYDKFSPTALRQTLNFEADGKKRAKILDLLATKAPDELNKHVDNLSIEDQGKLLKEIEARMRMFPGSEKNVLSLRPDLVNRMEGGNVNETIKKATEKTISNWSPEIFKSPDIVRELIDQNKLSKGLLRELAKKPDKFANMQFSLEILMPSKNPKDLEANLRRRGTGGDQVADVIGSSPHLSALWQTAKEKRRKNLEEDKGENKSEE